ncbi:MAG: IMP cyclohydrolase [Candidatus Eremiobacteraeota bacterium]|nr:IMP cyclohydrolase [Candidatus Eremiobacteraeota bacterium]MCW5872605.1 IMP cyclohydrolase [Candidatus Eremiobacteraeota bacterium]
MLKTAYRTARAESLPEQIEIKLGEQQLVLHKQGSLRYGENPHQSAAHYVQQVNLEWIKDGKGGPSWTNLADLDQAAKILRFMQQPAALVMKHLNPSGVAQGQNLAEVYRAARDCDARAAFGGVAVVNRLLDSQTAEAMLEGFLEVVAAPEFSPAALDLLHAKKDLRLARIQPPDNLPRFVGDPAPLELRMLVDGGCLLQESFLSRLRGTDDLERQSGQPEKSQLEDLLFAWYVTTGVRSNGVVIAREGRTLAVGTGQQERVGAVEQAIQKAREKGHQLEGAVLASDGFFPFRDSIDLMAEAGIKAVVQPGGSVKDGEVLAACQEHGMAMVFSGERCFGHF